MSTRFVMTDKIRKIEQRAAKRWLGGAGKDAKFIEDTQGWYAVFESCPASMYLGSTEPGLRAGDAVRLVLEKV